MTLTVEAKTPAQVVTENQVVNRLDSRQNLIGFALLINKAMDENTLTPEECASFIKQRESYWARSQKATY